MPQVSVVMPVYNREKFVAEAIESILQQTLTDFEFLIVDDGSTDGTVGIIQDYANEDARIRFFQHTENKGVAHARNTGLAHASGKYIAMMDSDDVSLPQRLNRQVAYLEAHPNIGGVGVHHRVCDEDMNPISSSPMPRCHYSIVFRFTLYFGIAMKCATMMVRQEFLDIQPAYNPKVVYGIDVDHFLRLVWEKTIRYANLSENLYLIRRHANTQGNRYRAIALQATNEVRANALRKLGAPGRAAEWILHKHPIRELNWNERRRARRDITRLIEAMVEHNWVDAEDEPLLVAEMNTILESTTPRHWQMFLHWYRSRISRHRD